MVFIEEIDDPAAVSGSITEVAPAKPALKKGFLNDEHKPLYGPEGSSQGLVSEDQKKKWVERDMSETMNKKLGLSADEEKTEENYPTPEWYTPEWPKKCQYNSPGCFLDPLKETAHQTNIHRNMQRDNARWKEIEAGNVGQNIRLNFLGITDEDIKELISMLRDKDVIEELDLSYNKISDTGVQTLVGALANGGFPNLRELRLYNNEFTELGSTMLTQGLKVLRKGLTVHVTDPVQKMAREL
eukprot:GEMP01062010.1.p1 GENE.GEMP01062010.1~~GEMP01062010.1.p1  ORF type:complete len:242 (+),score=54.75 GEMP01062010.1:110-835(+)